MRGLSAPLSLADTGVRRQRCAPPRPAQPGVTLGVNPQVCPSALTLTEDDSFATGGTACGASAMLPGRGGKVAWG